MKRLLVLACIAAMLMTGCRRILGQVLGHDAGSDPAAASGGGGAGTRDVTEVAAVFSSHDINGDEQLDGIEVQRCACAAADADKNGEVSKSEFLAHYLVTRNGPLPARGTAAAPATPAATTTPKATPTAPTTTPAAKAPTTPVAGGAGLPRGTYNCFGLVGRTYSARGSFSIVDDATYAVGSSRGAYVFDPATKKIRFTSGEFARPEAVSSAWQASPKEISMRTGKDGFYQWDCTRE